MNGREIGSVREEDTIDKQQAGNMQSFEWWDWGVLLCIQGKSDIEEIIN